MPKDFFQIQQDIEELFDIAMKVQEAPKTHTERALIEVNKLIEGDSGAGRIEPNEDGTISVFSKNRPNYKVSLATARTIYLRAFARALVTE